MWKEKKILQEKMLLGSSTCFFFGFSDRSNDMDWIELLLSC